jgi:predicted SprT family Zn-dependent metalloprotease
MNLAKLEIMAKDCLIHHGLAQQGWIVAWNNRKRSMGRCVYRTKSIELSRPVAALNNEDEMLDTVLHEIAHALAGYEANHNRTWKICAMSVGARPQHCGGSKVIHVPGKFQAVCPACSKTFNRHRKPNPLRMSRCPCFGNRPWNPSQYLIYKAVR